MLLRNDDVHVGTSVDELQKFCAVFDKYGFSQIHAICEFGNIERIFNYRVKPTGKSDTRVLIESVNNPFIDNVELVDFLKTRINDDIGTHGKYHVFYDKFPDDVQLNWIRDSKHHLEDVFGREVRYFVCPFNVWNQGTKDACDTLGMVLLAGEGYHIEEDIMQGVQHVDLYEHYRYHYWRFFDNPVVSARLDAIDRYLCILWENYRKHVSSYPNDISLALSNDKQRELKNALLLLIPDNMCGNVLDVGCNSGWFLDILRDKYGDAVKLYGIESTPLLARLMRSKGYYGSCGLAEELPFPDGYFKVVILSSILEQVISPKHVLREALRVCCDGGFIVGVNPEEFGGWGCSAIGNNMQVLNVIPRTWFSHELNAQCGVFNQDAYTWIINKQ